MIRPPLAFPDLINNLIDFILVISSLNLVTTDCVFRPRHSLKDHRENVFKPNRKAKNQTKKKVWDKAKSGSLF